jgi:hypothetical protein
MECNAVCQGIGQFLGNAFLWVVGAFLAVAVIRGIMGGIGEVISDARAKRLGKRRQKLEEAIQKLVQEIARLSLPTLTSEGIPQRFRSKQEAQAFGDKWSRGGPDSFSVGSFDADGRMEYQPQYDASRVAGGILYSKPALFFGLEVAYSDNDWWWLDFLGAKEAWLRSYRDSVRQPTRGTTRRPD